MKEKFFYGCFHFSFGGLIYIHAEKLGWTVCLIDLGMIVFIAMISNLAFIGLEKIFSS
jgi:hypothetical protein